MLLCGVICSCTRPLRLLITAESYSTESICEHVLIKKHCDCCTSEQSSSRCFSTVGTRSGTELNWSQCVIKCSAGLDLGVWLRVCVWQMLLLLQRRLTVWIYNRNKWAHTLSHTLTVFHELMMGNTEAHKSGTTMFLSCYGWIKTTLTSQSS